MRNITPGRILVSLIVLAGLWFSARQFLGKTPDENPGAPLITEFLASNQTGITDQDGDYSDWIEIYNPGPRAINLGRWSLSDAPRQPEKWTFPDIMLGSHEYVLVFASGKDRKPAQPGGELHANFKLDKQGEFLKLYAGQVDSTSACYEGDEFPQQFQDVSFGCSGEELGYLTPTPGQPNAGALLWTGLVDPVHFSQERGFYQAPLTLELSTPTPDASIRYTTDGSEPTELHGTLYNGPIAVSATSSVRAVAFKPGFRPAPAAAHTYIFLDQVLRQPQQPPGFRSTWGAYEGAPILADYEMDPEVVNDPRYRDVIEEALKSIPTLSLVTDINSFHELYANPRQKGREWERPVSVEYFNAPGDPRGFQINAGLRIQGELGRLEIIPKHSWRLFFRGEYGATMLEYPLFPGSPVEEFDTLTLRGGVNKSYAGWPESDQTRATCTRDEWLRASQIAMSGAGSHGIFVHLYLNGLYWGLYNVVERPDEAFMASYFGGAKEDWQSINHGETLTHSSQRFRTLHRLAAEGQLEDPAKYAAIQEYLDVPQFIDYLILNWYAGNLDWAFNNWYAGVQAAAGQVRYFAWDGERTWYEGAEIDMGLDEYNGQPNLVQPLFEALLANPDFRSELAQRLRLHLSDGGALSDENSRARWTSINAVIEQAIIAESARWGDTREQTPITQEDWFRARDDVLAQMQGNAARLIELAREAGYYQDNP